MRKKNKARRSILITFLVNTAEKAVLVSLERKTEEARSVLLRRLINEEAARVLPITGV
jgi:hypothetical protein